MNVDFDVIIIGAGAAGLMAANELAKSGKRITIVEARNRMGGRIQTLNLHGFTMPIEMGAEFVHGNLELTQKLVKEAGSELYKVDGKIWRHQKNKISEGDDFIEDYELLEDAFNQLHEDISVADFFEKYLNKPEHAELKKTLHGYVEGYNAADVNKASAQSLKEDLHNSANDQYRIKGGYNTIINYLAEQIKKLKVPVLLNTTVQQVNWKKDYVVLNTTKGEFTTKKILITVSLGVLQQELIKFVPAIPTKIEVAKTMGFGNVIKFIYEFNNKFWEDKSIAGENLTQDLGFLFTEGPVPTWWSQHPKDEAILTGWIGGPPTEKYKNFDDDALAELGLTSIALVYKLSKDVLKKMLRSHIIYNWQKDLESGGAYSYDTTGGEEKRKQLAEPIAETIFFAGEALAETTETGTVEAALESGKVLADIIIRSIKN